MSKLWCWLALAALALGLTAACSSASASTNASLANTSWSLVSIDGKAPVAGRALTLSFQSGNQLAGDSGCNSYSGHYQLNGNVIAIDQLVSTLRACAEQPLNDQEAVFLKALGGATQFSAQGNQLALQSAGGGEVLVFQKQ